jgi:hypothetical protein
VEERKDSNTLICLSNAVSLAMQIRSDHLIRKVIRSIFSKARIAFLWDGGSSSQLRVKKTTRFQGICGQHCVRARRKVSATA